MSRNFSFWEEFICSPSAPPGTLVSNTNILYNGIKKKKKKVAPIYRYLLFPSNVSLLDSDSALTQHHSPQLAITNIAYGISAKADVGITKTISPKL